MNASDEQGDVIGNAQENASLVLTTAPFASPNTHFPLLFISLSWKSAYVKGAIPKGFTLVLSRTTKPDWNYGALPQGSKKKGGGLCEVHRPPLLHPASPIFSQCFQPSAASNRQKNARHIDVIMKISIFIAGTRYTTFRQQCHACDQNAAEHPDGTRSSRLI